MLDQGPRFFKDIMVEIKLFYLGVFLGEDGCALSFAGPALKLQTRTRGLRLVGAGLSLSLLGYRSLAFSVMGHIMQLYSPDKLTLQVEAASL